MLSVLVFAVVFWVAVRINAPHGAEVAGVQVVLLKVDGREAAARVIDARAAGTVLVMPQEETR